MPTAVKRGLEEIRTDLDMSGAKLAEQAGVARSTISRIENKESGVTLLVAKRILRVLNAQREEFFPHIEEITRDDIDWEIV